MSDRANEILMERACAVIPGGVSSPVRAFAAVGGTPAFIVHANGAFLFDAAGKRYVDYVCSWGPMILGHVHPAVLEAVGKALSQGWSYGAPTEREIELTEAILALYPSMDMVRLVNSGTEAGMSAIRLARGATGRDLIIKFEGCYHGHADALLVKAGSGLATFGNTVGTSAGVPPDVVKDTLVLEYNNIEHLFDAFTRYGSKIAAVIMEPIAGNMNFVRASVPFTRSCQALTRQHGALLIYDEVMTGSRVALGGAQSIYAREIEDFSPDITMLGKVIGGGMPLAAFGGKRDIMKKLSPLGPVYQAGTLSGNPVATACGLETLRQISAPGFFSQLSNYTRTLIDSLLALAQEAAVPLAADCEGGMFGLFLRPELPRNYKEAQDFSTERFKRFFHGMLSRGIYLAPSPYEAGFTSSAHNDQTLELTLKAAKETFANL